MKGQDRVLLGADNLVISLLALEAQMAMFKILEHNNADDAVPIEIGHGLASREDAVSGCDPEAGYWWARDTRGLRKCWMADPPAQPLNSTRTASV